MYEVAFEEARRGLTKQITELNNARQRLLQFLSFIAPASAFIVGFVLNTEDKPSFFEPAAFVACGLGIGVLVGTVSILWPRRVLSRVSASTLVDKWIGADIASEEEFFLELALSYDAQADQNNQSLESARSVLLATVFAGLAQLILWAVISAYSV